jgi:phosphate-selective porin OprO and OprP
VSAWLLSPALLLWFALAALAGEDLSTGSAEPGVGVPERLKSEVRISAETNSASATKERSVKWDFAWRGWNGLYIEFCDRTRLSNPRDVWDLGPGTNFLPGLQLEEVKMSGTIGGRLEVDGAAFLTTGNLTGFADDVELRRALLSARGDCILVWPVSYLVEIGYRPNQFYVNKAYLLSQDMAYIGNLQVGVFGPPMGLDLITSSRDITFMEPPAPLQAMGSPNETGIQLGHPVLNQRATWALGLFGDAASDTEYGNASRNYGTAMGRLSWLPVANLDSDHPALNSYLHLGLSASYQYSLTSEVRYKSRPESFLAPVIIDTGDIDASGAGSVAAEVAWVNGPLCLQAEFIHSFVQGTNNSALNFGGFYAAGSWYLTGESRPYNPATGAFARLVPRRNFNFGNAGAWGAVELACRFSYTDLTDQYIHGGRLNLFMAGVNWYLNPHVRWMFNCGAGRVFDGPASGNLFLFQTRIGVDF